MQIWAVLALWADPVETVLLLLNGSDEVLASNNGVWSLADLLTRVLIEVNTSLSGIIERQVVTVLALLSFLTHTSLEIGADSLLVIDCNKTSCLEFQY